jgi:hypothetical protein
MLLLWRASDRCLGVSAAQALLQGSAGGFFTASAHCTLQQQPLKLERTAGIITISSSSSSMMMPSVLHRHPVAVTRWQHCCSTVTHRSSRTSGA